VVARKLPKTALLIALLIGLSLPRNVVAGELDLIPASKIVHALYFDMLRTLPYQYQVNALDIALFEETTPGIQARSGVIGGRRVIVVTTDLLDALLRVSYYVALAQTEGAESTGKLLIGKVRLYAPDQRRLPLPPDFEKRLSKAAFKQKMLLALRSMSCLVMGHELGHHYLGHIPPSRPCADIHEVLREQRKELEADTFGIYAVGWNHLDYPSALTFCDYMGELEPELQWPYFKDHPRWKNRARNLRIIVQSLSQVPVPSGDHASGGYWDSNVSLPMGPPLVRQTLL